MSIRTALAAGAIAAGTTAAALLPVTGAAAAPAATTQQVKVISSCAAARYKPTSYIFTCADANTGMLNATYDWWTTKTAHGTATYYYNDCKPYCAAGKVHKLQAEFTLFRVVKTAKYGPLFSRIEVDTRQGHQVVQLVTSTS